MTVTIGKVSLEEHEIAQLGAAVLDRIAALERAEKQCAKLRLYAGVHEAQENGDTLARLAELLDPQEYHAAIVKRSQQDMFSTPPIPAA
jgi:hypothetical protein